MQNRKFFYAALSIGLTLGAIGGYATVGDYVGAYCIGALGLAAGFMVWLVVTHLIFD